jgi:hypothetical protein
MKLNVGLAYTISDDNRGSRSASVSLEAELEAALILEPAKLHECVRHLSELIRQALTDELNASCHGEGPLRRADESSVAAGTPNATSWRAAPKQIKALYAVANERDVDVREVIKDRYDVQRPEELTIEQAGKLLNDLRRTDP